MQEYARVCDVVLFVFFPPPPLVSWEQRLGQASSIRNTDERKSQREKKQRATARIFKLLRSPRIDSKEPIPPGCVLCSLAGRYYNPIPTRFLAPIDCLKIPAPGQLWWKGMLDPNNAIANNIWSCHFNLIPLEYLSTMHKCLTLDLCLKNPKIRKSGTV